jgi:nitrite reductase/ring-hydroxylating ferredoxin subunit
MSSETSVSGPGDAGVAILYGDDAWLAGRLSRLGLTVLDGHEAVESGEPGVVIVDLATESAVDRVRRARTRWPQALVAGYLAVPDAARWLAGQRAGCDIVANRGAVVGRLRPLLAAGRPRRERFPLVDEADTAGRLGVVARVDDSPVGPVAVYRVEGSLVACEDVCPHQGAALSRGGLDGRTITCPRHGSQFDVTTGARTRGPADRDISRYPLLVDHGQVCLALAQDGPADSTEEGG